jgi:hypothetical protein
MRCIIDSNRIENAILQGAGTFTGFQLSGNSSTGNIARLFFRDNVMQNFRRNGNPSTVTGVQANNWVDTVVISRNTFDNIRAEVVTLSANTFNCIPIFTQNITAGTNNYTEVSNNIISNIYVTGNTNGTSHQITSQFGGFGS